MLIFLAVQYGFQLHVDVEAAFSNGNLQQDVYMAQPEGFVIEGWKNLDYKMKHCL